MPWYEQDRTQFFWINDVCEGWVSDHSDGWYVHRWADKSELLTPNDKAVSGPYPTQEAAMLALELMYA